MIRRAFANLPTFRFVGFSTCWLVGKLESWRDEPEGGSGAGARSQHSRKKRGWAHPPLSFPVKGRRRKEVCPPIVTEQGAEKSEE